MKYNRYPKRDTVKHYFPLPNEIFCLDLSAGEIAVYAYLMYCEDRKTFQCHPSYKTIGSAVGLSKNTVNILAAYCDVEEGTLANLRQECINEVKRINGTLGFEDAYHWQKD